MAEMARLVVVEMVDEEKISPPDLPQELDQRSLHLGTHTFRHKPHSRR